MSEPRPWRGNRDKIGVDGSLHRTLTTSLAACSSFTTKRTLPRSRSILVLNREVLSPEQEMVTDLMTIVHCFSSRLYGLRNYRKILKKALVEGETK